MEVARLVHEASSSEKVWDTLSDENKDKKESRVKSVLCKFAPTYMNRTLLGEIDLGNDLLEWFQDIIELCEPD